MSGRLTRGLLNPVTDADVRAVHRHLETLGRGDYLPVLSRLEERGLLSRYVAEQGAAEREAFLGQLHARGVLVRRPEGTAPPGPLRPPAPPGIVDVPRTLLPTLRALAHDENLGAAGAYGRARGAYLERYVDAVERAQSAAELRVLGPAAPRLPSPVGTIEPSWMRIETVKALGSEDRSRASQAVNARHAVLAGRMAPSTARLEASGKVVLGPVHVEFGGSLGPQGLVKTGSLGLVVNHRGLEGKVAIDPEPLLAAELPHPKTSLGFSVAGKGGMELADDGTLALGLRAARVRVTPGVGRVSAGLGKEVRLGKWFELKGEVLATAQLSDPRNAPRIGARGETGGPPPELEQRVPWEALPAGRRVQLGGKAVRAEFWNSLLTPLPTYREPSANQHPGAGAGANRRPPATSAP